MNISIITPILNPGDSLRATVLSVLQQTHEDWEMVIKDAGVGLDLHYHNFNEPKIKWVNAPDSGIYDGMNQALKFTSSDWVIFLNAGDSFYSPNVLSTISSAIVKVGPNVGCIYGDMYNQLRSTIVRQPSRLSNFFLYRQNINHQTQVWRKSMLEAGGGFNLRYLVRSDQEFLLRMRKENGCQFLHVPKIFISYEDGGYSTSSANLERSNNELEEIRRSYFSKFVRFKYILYCFLTFKPFRVWLVRKHYNSPLGKFYSVVVNSITGSRGLGVKKGKKNL